MTMQITSEFDEDRAARARMADAAKQCLVRAPEVPSSFIADLFGRVTSEDLAQYGAGELATLAIEAWSFLATRRPGTPKIRMSQPEADGSGRRLKDISVLEIVNDDMPFLVDSVMADLAEKNLEILLVAHPIFAVTRDADGHLSHVRLPSPSDKGAARESFIHIHLGRIDDEVRRTEIIQDLERVLADVRVAVADWLAMRERIRETTDDLKGNPPPLPVGEISEAIQFLDWLAGDNFTFLGMRDYVFGDNLDAVQPVFDSSLGIMRAHDLQVLRRGGEFVSITPEIRAFLQEPKLLIVTKAAVRAQVHRRIYMDYIGVKRFDANGNLVGELRIVGLFTSTAYTRPIQSIPYIRRKTESVFARAGFDPASHSGKALVNVLESYPRDDLFQIDEDTLHQFALAILQLDERPRVRVLARRDRFDRFMSVLVFVPRERYSTRIGTAVGEYLAREYHGRVSAIYPVFPDSPLVRVHYIIGRHGGDTVDPSRATLERGVGDIIRTWVDGLASALKAAHDGGRATALFDRYRDAFSDGYRDHYTPETAVEDIKLMEGLSSTRLLGVDFHPPEREAGAAIALKVWSYSRPIPLSERVPVLENMGFHVVDERTHHIEPAGEATPGIWLHDMELDVTDGTTIDFDNAQTRLEAAFLMVMSGVAESDGYNALVLSAGLMWRDVALIRAISRFLRQVRIPYSQDYMWNTLNRHPVIAADIVALLHARFDPHLNISDEERQAREAEIVAKIEAALNDVSSLDEDRILRHFVNAVQSALRTNYWQLDGNGQPKAQIAIKYSSRKIDGLPLPRPLYEIFVYSPRVEGVHLRFGKVARGGIRWSDRPQDFRTEVLGLVKAQQVKNAVIVPVGAKGGFVPKLLPKGGQRDAIQAEGTAAYKLFISTLLDVTDNIGSDGVIPPADVVRKDDDDPYLVVAADKGTATFSDTANQIAIDDDFWLGDAFASGGSAGYDHKKMGITARGAWESVKRHFREMEIDIAKTPFTVAGVGDMSGDVFGNGMLREKTINLVAAFDHRDIFLDPNPDPETSFAERQRLFDLPRSSWQDYDKSLISAGGGVFSRASKEIPLSSQVQTVLGLKQPKATPQEVMKAILKAPVDLLWFGGIGTYVRAGSETDEAAGDRANDAIRVKGEDLTCKVIGEGANLGMTQLGRIEAALRGIRLNTDAIDNSAGVNTSDVEVNLKIALAPPMREGQLTLDQRNALLAEMTDEVAELVLRNNYQQTLALTLAQKRGLEDLGFQQRLMQTLEVRGLLDRPVEFLPDDLAIAERRRQNAPLTRPELSVLLAYAKLSLDHDLVESSVPDDPYLSQEAQRYFPHKLLARFPDALARHRLRREIIATQLTNSMISRGGPTLIVRIADQTGASAAEIAAAFAAVRGSFGMIDLNTEIEALDNRIATALQTDLFIAVQNALFDRLVWFLRHVDFSRGLQAIVDHYRAGVEAVGAALKTALPAETRDTFAARAAELAKAGVPDKLAQVLGYMPALVAAPDIVAVADRTSKPVADVAATYFAVEAFFKLDRIAQAARAIVVTDYFDGLALDRALDTIGAAERRITAAVLASGATGAGAVDAWVASRKADVERIRAAVHEIAASGLTLSKLTVAASMLGDLVKE